MSVSMWDVTSIDDNRAETRPVPSKREIEVVLAWFRCETKYEVCRELYLSIGTVNTHLSRVRNKYASIGRPAPTKSALLARFLQDGLIGIDDL